MFSKGNSKKGRSLIIVLCGLAMLALAGSSASAAQSCKKISGKFTLQTVSGPVLSHPWVSVLQVLTRGTCQELTPSLALA